MGIKVLGLSCVLIFVLILRKQKRDMEDGSFGQEGVDSLGDTEYRLFYYKDYPSTSFVSSPQLASKASFMWVAGAAIAGGAIIVEKQKHVGLEGRATRFCKFDHDGYLEVTYRKLVKK